MSPAPTTPALLAELRAQAEADNRARFAAALARATSSERGSA